MDVINQAGNLLSSAFTWLHDLVPGGFGLLILPIGALAIVTLWAVRRS